ncbi:ABC sugar (xylose) transporter, periplasmic binding protein [Oceanicola granulosus HTCC2516]|uniref:ABC sugar (Xylose) transporter, periplasmic binding protein n=1 Tax=Oceanicola granulosus (strain ATCC BAA-861 / DSM 15982 / KCTC 12143 / HTCC2516) TaxID=314256 RepID=Q2CEL0_OCEGH|nr:ABC sugar (xylose) transporter, periplasmic binding protein [Oceanicola granulosus HTCC2516]
MATALPMTAIAQDGPRVGMSWANFQEERWKIDQAGIEAALEELGGELISTDAQSSSSKQASDIESLLARDIDALMIVSQDSETILASVERALNSGVPVVAYERQIEHPDVTYVAFDPVEVGRIQARAVTGEAPEGNYVIIKGSPTDPYTTYVLQGQREIIDPMVEAGDIEVVAEQFTDGWLPSNAQRNMEQILTVEDNDVDAVLAANDGTAGGVVAALEGAGLAGDVPVSGQDGDIAALNRIARGTQTVTAWKDTRELGRLGGEVVTKIIDGEDPATIEGAQDWDKGAQGITQTAIVLSPVAITRDNLDVVVDAGWISTEDLCQGVSGDGAPEACQ